MEVLVYILLGCYIVVTAIICVYGTHRYWLMWRFLRDRRRGATQASDAASWQGPLPTVTVQLPMFNERNVAERIIRAAAAIDYPADRLEVQVLDDSTDETTEIARACVAELAASGVDIELIHRDNRKGYKAGALAEGLERAKGEMIAVFDADFVPPPDILRHTIDVFSDPQVGMVQTRWGHLNRGQSMLTRIQALFLDGHFVIEQTARHLAGRWFNFNGTAGVWRRQCIEDAGGWQQDTLTEDTDLSYRAQMAGWTFRYLPEVQCPAELPPTVGAMMTQQHRWNKGLTQVARKLLPRILSGDVSTPRKVEAWFHLTSPVMYVVIVALALLAIPSAVLGYAMADQVPGVVFAAGTTSLLLGTIAACSFYMVSQYGQGLSVGRTILLLPGLMAVGIGLSIINSKAVLEGLAGRSSPFVRTPKYGGRPASSPDPQRRRAVRGLPRGTIELLIAVALAVCLVLSLFRPVTLMSTPFLALFAAGFALVGAGALRD